MKDFRDGVAVITGAASGIGRGLAERCAQEGMKVVLADVDSEKLAETEVTLKAGGAATLAVRTDVSQAKDIEALVKKTSGHSERSTCCATIPGSPQVELSGKAAIRIGNVCSASISEAVIHGVRTFVPIMLAQGTECHVVNTASMSGLISFPRGSVCAVTKHGVVALSEALHHELAERGGKVKVSVLCPGLVQTRIVDSARLAATAPMVPVEATGWETLRQQMQTGMPPEQVADAVFRAIHNECFYILTHPEGKDSIRTRIEDVLQDRSPTLPG
jgi:short-subunit dehydrogenase